MKVVYLGPHAGGIFQYTQKLKKAIQRIDPEVEVSYIGPDNYRDVNISEIKSESPDIIHAQIGERDPIQNILSEFSNENLVLTLHEVNLWLNNKNFIQKEIDSLAYIFKSQFYDKQRALPAFFWNFHRFMDKMFYRRSEKNEDLSLHKMAKHLFVLSEYAKQYLIRRGLESSVVPHPPNIPKYHISDSEKKSLCRKYEISDNTVLANPGYYPLRWKCYKILKNSIKKLSDLDADILVTGGNFTSLGFKNSYQFGRAKIRFFSAGNIPDKEMSFLFQNTLALVLAYEPGVGFCQSGLLPIALEHGTPIVGTSAGSMGEYVKDAGVITSFDPIELAYGIREIITEPDKRNRLSQRAIEVSKQLSWESNAKKTLEVYNQIIS
jgi:glycosyltransferase involved in cell wall biosynthesis